MNRPLTRAVEKIKKTTSQNMREPIQVYCRLRPTVLNEVSCMKIISQSTIQMSTPENSVNFREGNVKETQHTFSYIFDQNTSQKKVFDHAAAPLVDGLIHGKNGLLFTYGITCSGKTYTMTGSPEDCGIMPRALDCLFNTILNFQAKKFVFKPDRLNGFEVQSEEDAKMEAVAELHFQSQATQFGKTPSKTPSRFRRKESEWAKRTVEEMKINNIEEDNMYAVFITYVEIYNNSVFDLLDENFEETSRMRGPQTKLVREDGAKNMYVHGVTEVEVKSTEEAFEAFIKGQWRKRMAHNSINTESSRSHSVFTVRLVQAPLDAYGETMLTDKKNISVSQLSFVDLAGSERTSRTNTTGQRLREAGNINNSLMTLRTCLEILRENQVNGTNKLVPYRDSKLTHLFKNYFDGESVVRVIVCVNPRVEDFDENLHVMKFAEMSQEVQVVNPTPLRPVENLPSGRRRANQIFKRAVANLNLGSEENIPSAVGVPKVYSLASQFPEMTMNDPEDERLIKNLMMFLEVEIQKQKKVQAEAKARTEEWREQLIEVEKELVLLRHQNSLLTKEKDHYKDKVTSTESTLVKTQSDCKQLKLQVSSLERIVKRLQEELKEKDQVVNRGLMDREKEKQRFQSKFAQTAEKLNQQMETKLMSHRRRMEMEVRNKEMKIAQVKRILSDEAINAPPLFPSYDLRAASTDELGIPSSSCTPSSITQRKRAGAATPRPTGSAAVCNPRHRRSRSVSDERWLEHRPQNPVLLNTVLQPVLKKRKSITKLTDVKDVANNKTSKYCLMTQEQDSEGDLETHIYKGDVVPTCGGGAQVILNDVEILKQKSPGSSPTRKRSGHVETETGVNCMVSIEGHPKRSKH